MVYGCHSTLRSFILDLARLYFEVCLCAMFTHKEVLFDQWMECLVVNAGRKQPTEPRAADSSTSNVIQAVHACEAFSIVDDTGEVKFSLCKYLEKRVLLFELYTSAKNFRYMFSISD